MKIPIKPRHVKRYKEFALLLLKYGQKELVRTVGLDQVFSSEEGVSNAAADGAPEELVKDLEALGPTFIKLGQLLSTRPDLLSPPYVAALSRLQDSVHPFEFEKVEEIISKELGVRMSKAFEEFDREPIAAASLGQVHQAKLPGGRSVAVKVQRPGVKEIIVQDLDILDEITGLVDQHTDIGRRYAFQQMLHEFRKTLLEELDYRQEAKNLTTLGESLSDYAGIVVPEPVSDYSTAVVLTMDFLRGTKITEISPLTHTEMDCKALAEELLRAYLDQILLEGFFHADPHPGNILITDDGKLALLDIGMVARLDPSVRERLLKLLLAISDGRGYEAAERVIEMGTRLENFNEPRFKRQVGDLISRHRNADMGSLKIGRIILELARISAQNGIRPPLELTVLGKTLLNLDEVGCSLAPEFKPNEVIQGHAKTLMSRHIRKSLSPENIFSTTLEVQEFFQKLPTRLNRVLDSLARNEMQFKVHTVDEKRLRRSLEKIANRISLGIVLAALIVGAAMIMRVESTLTILGYPAIAIVLFLFAALGGIILIFSILLGDRRK